MASALEVRAHHVAVAMQLKAMLYCMCEISRSELNNLADLTKVPQRAKVSNYFEQLIGNLISIGRELKNILKSFMDSARYLEAANRLATCSNCGAPKMPHYACGACGAYAGRQARPIAEG